MNAIKTNWTPEKIDPALAIPQLLDSREILSRLYDNIREQSRSDAMQQELARVSKASDKSMLRVIEGSLVSFANSVVLPHDELRDAMGRWEPLKELRFAGSQGLLLLVDPFPRANWAHPCWIATLDLDSGELRCTLNDFPPQESPTRRLVPFGPLRQSE